MLNAETFPKIIPEIISEAVFQSIYGFNDIAEYENVNSGNWGGGKEVKAVKSGFSVQADLKPLHGTEDYQITFYSKTQYQT